MSTVYAWNETESNVDVLASDDKYLIFDTSAGTMKYATPLQSQDRLVTTASTASNISNNGLTIITATSALNYTLDPPVAGRRKTLVCQTTAAATVTQSTTTATTIGAAFHKLTFGSTDVADPQSITLEASSALRWEVVAKVGTTAVTTT